MGAIMKMRQANPAFASAGFPASLVGAKPNRHAGRFITRVSEDVAAFFDMVDQWRQRANDRQVLASMDDRSLQDIGFSRIDAEAESTKPFWRA